MKLVVEEERVRLAVLDVHPRFRLGDVVVELSVRSCTAVC